MGRQPLALASPSPLLPCPYQLELKTPGMGVAARFAACRRTGHGTRCTLCTRCQCSSLDPVPSPTASSPGFRTSKASNALCGEAAVLGCSFASSGCSMPGGGGAGWLAGWRDAVGDLLCRLQCPSPRPRPGVPQPASALRGSGPWTPSVLASPVGKFSQTALRASRVPPPPPLTPRARENLGQFFIQGATACCCCKAFPFGTTVGRRASRAGRPGPGWP